MEKDEENFIDERMSIKEDFFYVCLNDWMEWIWKVFQR